MPAKRSRARHTDNRLALRNRVAQIGTEIARLKRDRAAVNRDEFLEMTKSLRQLQQNTDELVAHSKDLAIQFTRIAQIQVEVDVIKRALVKAKLAD
jgi:seryl-tRNA synthetase